MSSVIIAGNTSGTITLDAPNVAGTTTLTLPTTSATLLTDSSGVLNIGSGQVYKDASGNVGIGTTTISTGYTSGNGSLTLQNAKSIAFNNASNTWSTSTTGGAITYFTDNNLYIDAKDSASNMLFRVNGATERMRIDSSGNLLVSTTTTTGNGAAFQVAGSGGGMMLRIAKASEGTAHQFAVNSSVVGTIYASPSSTSYNTSSDYRLKENIAPMTGALNVVQQLKPVTYNWKVDGSDGQGFIAHELQEVVPDCVVGDKDAVDEDGNPKYQGVDTSFLVATLTAAIQELKAELDAVKTELATLKGAA